MGAATSVRTTLAWGASLLWLGMFGTGRAVAADHCTLGKLAELPITMSGPRALVTVGINDHQVQLTADSGAFYSMLSPASAASLGLKSSQLAFVSVRGVGGGATDAAIANVKSLSIAGSTVRNVDFLVGGSEMRGAGLGVLGRNILYLGDVEFDFAHGFIRLFKAEKCTQKALVYWGGSYSEVPVSMRRDTPESSNILADRREAPWMFSDLIPAAVNGQEIHAELDTGMPTSMLTLKAAAKAGVTPDSPGVVSAGEAYGVGRNSIRTYIARFDSFKIGGEEIKNARLRFGDIDLPGIDMLLGMDFAQSHRIYVAHSQRKMYFSFNGGSVFDLSIKSATTAQLGTAPAPSGVTGDGADAGEGPADHARRGEALESRREFEQALAELNRACELAPDNAEYLFRRGLIHQELQQTDEARADFDQSLQLRPDDVNALLTRADLRIRTGDRAGARADLDAADSAAAKQAGERFRMAMAYLRIGQPDIAISQIGLWIDSHDRDAMLPAALNERCRIRAVRGIDLTLALKDCSSAMHLVDKSAAIYPRIAANRGLVYLRMGEFDKSMGDYDTAVKLNPRDGWSWYGRGIDKLKKHKTQDGKADIAHAMELAPGVAEEFKSRGIADPAAL